MADRKPIVYVDGLPQQLASGDRLGSIGAVTVAASAPSSPKTGDLWMEPTGNILKVWTGSAWTEPSETVSTIVVAGTAPSSPNTGLLWYDTTVDALKVYTGSAWNPTGNKTFNAAVAPTSGMIEGDWWYNSTSGAFSMYIAGSLNSWVIVSSGGGGGGGGSVNDILAYG